MTKKRFTAVSVMALILFSLFVVAKPASAAEPQGDVLKIVQLASQNNLFMDVFNPSPSGMSDVYVVRTWYFLHDPGVIVGPDAQYHNYRCQLVDVKYNVQVPEDAYVWNGTQKKWVNPYANQTAKSAITWKCGLGEWNDGQPMTLADFMFSLAMNFEWAYQDGSDDKYFDEAWGNNAQDVMQNIWGFKVEGISDDYVTYTIYQDFVVPYDTWGTAIGNYYEYPSIPWQLYNVLSEAVANGVGGKTFSWSQHPQDGFKLDMVDPEQAPYFKQEAESLLNSGGLIPVWLSSLDPVLQAWGISKEKAGITEDLAKEGYNKVIEWVDKYNNVLISSGPYYMEKYDPKVLTITLKLANNKRIGFATDEINGVKLPFDPYWKEIQIYGTANAQTAILAVAQGEYDFYWYETGYKDLANVMKEYGNNVDLVKTIAVWWSVNLNLVGDPNTGIVNATGTDQFNPFALREVRYAMNWLLNRNYIVSNILQGGGAPMFGPEVSGQVDAATRIKVVAKALGFTAQGDEQFALKMIDDAMKKAAQNLQAKGHTLEKKDGMWYFDGEPVKVKLIARVEDERPDEGKYIGQVLKKAGFDVEVLQWTRTQASKTVYSSDPTTLQWHVYTEGWVVRGIQPPSSIAWDFWFFDYYVCPNWGTSYQNPMTLKDLIQATTGGDVNKFITDLNMKYYNTPDKLEPLMDWTGYDFAMVLAYNSWTGPENYKVKIQNIDQFWDLYKIAYGLHALNSPRVYTAETWQFYLVNKKVKVTMPDPIGGLESFLAVRSVRPSSSESAGVASTTSTSTYTNTNTNNEESYTNTVSSTSISPTTSNTYSSTSNAYSSSYTSSLSNTVEIPENSASSNWKYILLIILIIAGVGGAAFKVKGGVGSTKPPGESMIDTPHGTSTGYQKPKVVATPQQSPPEKTQTPIEQADNLQGFPSELLSRYEPLEFLGEGGFAKVFKAKRKKDGKVVAIKIPRIDEKTSKTFIKEVSTWLHLDHPNIVKLYDVDILPRPYLEMEFVEGINTHGKTIRDLDEYPKPVNEKTALNLIRNIAEGLKHAHSKEIYHRDLKPKNILLKADLTPKITDWGLAKLGTMSSSRSVLGYTPLYASPEHLLPSKYGHTDHRTDIWQLGVTFYELLTGRLPFDGYTYEEVFGKIVDEEYRFTPPSKINPELAKYDGIFEKLLAKRKEERYQSVEEFLKELDKLEESEKRKAELEEEIEKLKKTLTRTVSALKESRSAEEALKNRKLVVETLGKLALAYAELNRKAELLNTLNDLKFYTVQNLNDLLNAIETVELLIKEDLPISPEFIEKLKVLVHNIKRENGA